MILTPGAQKDMLARLATLKQLVIENTDHEAIMYRTAELMLPACNHFAYYIPPKKKTPKKH